MNRHFILFALAFAAALSGFAKTFDVDISTGRPAASNEAYYHGETVEFRAVRGKSVVTNIEYSCVYYQTNGMDSVWWHTDGLVFHPTNDVGAASYRFFMEGRDDLGRDWHANGLLRLLPSPGFTPNTIELPVARLDFAAVEVLNPPYYDKAETEAKIVELAPAPGNYAAVSNAAVHAAATNALQDAAISTLSDSISTLNDTKADETTPVVQPPSLPANCLPITGTYYGLDFSLSTVQIGGGGTEYYAYGTDAGGHTIDFAWFDGTTGKYKSSGYGIDALKFNGRAPTVNSWPALNLVVTGGAVVRSPEFSDALGKKVDIANAEVDRKLLIYGEVDDYDNKSYPVEIIADYTGGVVTPTIVSNDGSTLKRYRFPVPDYLHGQYYLNGTIALTSDIPTVPTAQINAATTTNALQDAAIAGKQDKLPYPTNAIPYAAISGKPSLATVATSGSYNDLSNKPTIPTVPTNVSAFNNDAGYLTGYTESDPTIKPWAKADTKPTYTASEVGAATAEDVYRIVAGTNVILVVTNYNSAVHAPAMKLQHLDPESGQYVTYWDETRRHGMTLTNAMDYTDAAAAAELSRADAAYAPRAWSGTTSALGAEAPTGVTWISTPETVIAGGYEYEKVITAAGAVWVLTSNGLTTGATTNSFFRVSASDGTELFSIEKTDSYLVGVNATGITKSGNTVTIPVNVVAPSHPYIRATTNLVNAVWTKEDENGFTCPFASVSWSGSSGAYVATVTCSQPQAFFYFEFMQQGTAKIKNSAKTEMTGGIIFNGTTYMPTVNGNKLEFVAQ